ncbi:putative WD domain-containing protein [Colletotrichum truncatum]|uniref:WD domain-containing protein n=1 Tax=Colletotrichum truncatum TaxID=5467 RepID=A0ACC3YXI4_COLTU|nr:putative WD domain-containing protein [Colletotrichum truncatum]KAF6792383.1 putative WD domain-containing protein [Colletotrichum truncatum]
MHDLNITPEDSLLAALLGNNQKVTRVFCSESSNASTKKRQRSEFAETTTESLSNTETVRSRFLNEYSNVQQLPAALAAKQPAPPTKSRRIKAQPNVEQAVIHQRSSQKLLEGTNGPATTATNTQSAPAESDQINSPLQRQAHEPLSLVRRGTSATQTGQPEWHPPWKLMRVISGHLGWVRSLAVEPGNKWFASGAGDRTIKIWDLATGSLRLTLTGHISTVRGLAVSPRHPYLFSCGEDKMVKCWDLETNKVIRHYHGHLSGVYTLSLHPTLDVLVTGGRDGVARVWDMRTRSNIHVLSGHTGTVSDVKCQEADPQVITGSLDTTVRLWDLAAGKTMGVLTHHKKGVRALATHPQEFTFATGSTGSIKQWKCPEGAFMQNFEGHNAIINTLNVNQENVLFSGGDNGSMSFWDWKTGHRFQSLDTTAQPGSLDAEAGIMSSTFDRSGLRLICGEADKTIKIWKQDEKATPETHPVAWQPTLSRRKF